MKADGAELIYCQMIGNGLEQCSSTIGSVCPKIEIAAEQKIL